LIPNRILGYHLPTYHENFTHELIFICIHLHHFSFNCLKFGAEKNMHL
jgi:hypothetical protein